MPLSLPVLLSSCLRALCTVYGIGWHVFEPLAQSMKQKSKETQLLQEMGIEAHVTFCLLHHDREIICDAI